jgi:hypothetical protein
MLEFRSEMPQFLRSGQINVFSAGNDKLVMRENFLFLFLQEVDTRLPRFSLEGPVLS